MSNEKIVQELEFWRSMNRNRLTILNGKVVADNPRIVVENKSILEEHQSRYDALYDDELFDRDLLTNPPYAKIALTIILVILALVFFGEAPKP